MSTKIPITPGRGTFKSRRHRTAVICRERFQARIWSTAAQTLWLAAVLVGEDDEPPMTPSA
ncbi:hypothetical protein ABZY05_37595 [Streptomyces canus]|uniref:hypothetical protein n=1 Tax=Streptomyces canus TaxID=58343 RepID=UPI0033BB5185